MSYSLSQDFKVDAAQFQKLFFGDNEAFEDEYHSANGDSDLQVTAWVNDQRTLTYKHGGADVEETQTRTLSTSGLVVKAHLVIHPNSFFAPSEFYNDVTYTVTNRGSGSTLTIAGVISPSFIGSSIAASKGKDAAQLWVNTALKHQSAAPRVRAVFAAPMPPRRAPRATKTKWALVLMAAATAAAAGYATYKLWRQHKA